MDDSPYPEFVDMGEPNKCHTCDRLIGPASFKTDVPLTAFGCVDYSKEPFEKTYYCGSCRLNEGE